MMLPGVELARKRRIHHHEIQSWGPQGHTPQPLDPLESSMAEPALAARIRLEERLRGGCATSQPSNFSSRLSQFMRNGANTSRQQNTTAPTTTTTATTSTNNATTQRVDQTEVSHSASVPDRPLLKRLASRGDDLCAVCLEEVTGKKKKKVMRLPCSHKYHSDCVLPWLAAHPDCPCCRTAVPPIDTF
ncbi:RING/U-box superfamily protein [Rhynchospora pubera]|uniref:RING/U-box superfamily protein n=1 Tax=Rhynchospora pubera TaxID=906938 RepID=A0AAV8CM39_9POAL|nr:RING/U-box superfamily protein [Rhynchospora pubera]